MAAPEPNRRDDPPEGRPAQQSSHDWKRLIDKTANLILRTPHSSRQKDNRPFGSVGPEPAAHSAIRPKHSKDCVGSDVKDLTYEEVERFRDTLLEKSAMLLNKLEEPTEDASTTRAQMQEAIGKLRADRLRRIGGLNHSLPAPEATEANEQESDGPTQQLHLEAAEAEKRIGEDKELETRLRAARIAIEKSKENDRMSELLEEVLSLQGRIGEMEHVKETDKSALLARYKEEYQVTALALMHKLAYKHASIEAMYRQAERILERQRVLTKL